MSRKKKPKKEEAIYWLKKGTREAFYGFSSVLLAFLVLLILSMAFLFYQYKEYKILQYSREIQQLKVEILKLNSQNNRLKSRIHTRLSEYNRIARVVRDKLGLVESIEKPTRLRVDKKTYEKFARKDEEELLQKP